MVFQDWKNVSGDPAWAPSPAGMPLQQADAPAASEEGASGAPPVAPTIPTPGLSVTGSMLSDSEEDGAGNMTVGGCWLAPVCLALTGRVGCCGLGCTQSFQLGHHQAPSADFRPLANHLHAR